MDNIADETRQVYNLIKFEVGKGNDNVMPYLSGTLNKRTKMYKAVERYEKDFKIDYRLGMINKETYEREMKVIYLCNKCLANFTIV